jgi:hypothetical protein
VAKYGFAGRKSRFGAIASGHKPPGMDDGEHNRRVFDLKENIK